MSEKFQEQSELSNEEEFSGEETENCTDENLTVRSLGDFGKTCAEDVGRRQNAQCRGFRQGDRRGTETLAQVKR